MKYSAIAISILAVCLLSALSNPALPPPQEDFEHGIPPDWTVEHMGPQNDQGHVETDLEQGGNHFLRIHTDGTFYSFGIDTPFDPERYPILKWRWRVDRMPSGADISVRQGDDAAARLYVVFRDARSPDHSPHRRLEYVWDTSHPAGTVIPDPYSPDTVKAIVLESGSAKAGQWVREEVNLVTDFQRAFGVAPGWVKTIAFASDSEETHSATVSDFDDLQINAATSGQHPH